MALFFLFLFPAGTFFLISIQGRAPESLEQGGRYGVGGVSEILDRKGLLGAAPDSMKLRENTRGKVGLGEEEGAGQLNVGKLHLTAARAALIPWCKLTSLFVIEKRKGGRMWSWNSVWTCLHNEAGAKSILRKYFPVVLKWILQALVEQKMAICR